MLERLKKVKYKEQKPLASGVLLILLFLLAVYLGPFKGLDKLGLISQNKSKEQPSLATTLPNEATSSAGFVSNELLIKVKGEIKNNVREGKPANTGITSLNSLNRVSNATGFERVAKIGKNSNKNSDIFRWYKVTLAGERKILSTTNGNAVFDREILKLNAILAKYSKDPNIERVEPNIVVRTQNIPNDYYYSSKTLWSDRDDLWGLKKLETEKAWDISTGSDQVLVAVVDTGIDYNHPDLSNNIWANSQEIPNNGIDDDGDGFIDDVRGWDFANNDNDPVDDNGHGTHVSGTIGAVGNNDLDHSKNSGTRVVGVNQKVKLMAVKFLNSYGAGSAEGGIQALRYAADMGAKVISNSWGGTRSQATNDAVKYAYEQGAVVIAAAGNDNSDSFYTSPASAPEAITVAASNYQDNRSCFSNYGAKIDVAAPGGDATTGCTRFGWPAGVDDGILSTIPKALWPSIDPEGYYALASGTSMATPHVSGLAALILSNNPDFTPDEVRQVIRQSADKISGKEWDQKFGYGRINALKALAFGTPPPVAKISSPACNDILGTTENIVVWGTAKSRLGPVHYELFWGQGLEPTTWLKIADGNGSIDNGVIASLTPSGLGLLTYKLVVTDIKNVKSYDRVTFNLDDKLMKGWPKSYEGKFLGILPFVWDPAIADLDGNGKSEAIVSSSGENKIYAWQMDGTALPGWPAQTDNLFNGTPVVSDLNGDGRPEVIVASWDFLAAGAKLYVFGSDGKALPGWPKTLPLLSLTTPALGDIDGDGKKEIVFISDRPLPEQGKTDIYVLKADGTNLAGWPKTLNVAIDIFIAPTLFDIDKDNRLEIFFPTFGSVYGLDDNTEVLPGWPQSIEVMYDSPVVIGDINKDGEPEIIEHTRNNLYVWKTDGTPFNSNWPKTLAHVAPCGSGFGFRYTAPILADINSDQKDEILVQHHCEKIHAFTLEGLEASGWPKDFVGKSASPSLADLDLDGKFEILIGSDNLKNKPGIFVFNNIGTEIFKRDYGYTWAAPYAGDFDGDGKIEIVATLNVYLQPKLYVWKYGGSAIPGTIFWSQFLHNEMHTGSLVPPPPCASYGDVNLNGIIDKIDSNAILKYVLGTISLTDEQKRRADVDGNRKVESADSLLVSQYANGLRDNFPMCVDADKDGFVDPVETYIGTDPYDNCPDNTSDPAWPPDINNDKAVNILDVLKFSPKVNGPYDKRYDFNTDGKVNILDVLLMKPYMGKTCQ